MILDGGVMMKINFYLQKPFVAWLALLICLPTAWTFAGNKKMVEKEVAELDAANKQVLSELPELPANGQVKVKARFHGERGGNEVEILQSNIIEGHTGEPPQTHQETIDFN